MNRQSKDRPIVLGSYCRKSFDILDAPCTSSAVKIYFVGIAGTAMAASALIARDMGHDVSGSDAGVYPPMSDILSGAGIHWHDGFSADTIDKADLYVIGNAITRGNPEAEEILNRRLPFVSLPQFIREIILQKKKPVVVTGTHGKTTTTALIAHLFSENIPGTGYMVAGNPFNFPTPGKKSDSDWFIIEGDEYDSAFFDKRSKFIHYLPHFLIINNIEFDHADIFENMEALKKTFRHLVRTVPQNALLLVNGDDANAIEVAANSHTRILTFGLGETNDYRAVNMGEKNGYRYFEIVRHGVVIFSASMNLYGEHNVRNTLAAVAAAIEAGLEPSRIAKSLLTFKGVERRLQRLTSQKAPPVFDDFAHHPTAIRFTLQTLKKQFPENRLIAILEPRSNTLVTNIFQKEITEALLEADIVYMAQLHRKDTIPPEKQLSPENIRNAFNAHNKKMLFVPDISILEAKILEDAKPSDVIVFMSNGEFGGLPRRIAKSLDPTL